MSELKLRPPKRRRWRVGVCPHKESQTPALQNPKEGGARCNVSVVVLCRGRGSDPLKGEDGGLEPAARQSPKRLPFKTRKRRSTLQRNYTIQIPSSTEHIVRVKTGQKREHKRNRSLQRTTVVPVALAAGDGADDQETAPPRRDRVGQRSVRRSRATDPPAQAKNRTNGRRCCVTWSRIVPRSIG